MGVRFLDSLTSRLYALGRGFQTSCGLISLNAWFNSEYAVDATAGVYSFVGGWALILHSINS